MEATAFRRPKQLEPAAPVAGGIRWHHHYHDILEHSRRCGLIFNNPDQPCDREPDEPPRGTDGAPIVSSTPPPEARVGAEYIYRARAYDGFTDGFTWYFEKSPEGMRVDRHTGRVTWVPAEGGYVEAVLCARSVYGGESRQRWTICVRRLRRVRPWPSRCGFDSPPPDARRDRSLTSE